MSMIDYEKYFFNVVSEKWLDDQDQLPQPAHLNVFKNVANKTKKIHEINFDIKKVQEFIGSVTSNDQNGKRHVYIFGQYMTYYFIGVFEDDECYPHCLIYKHDTLVPLVSKIPNFKEIFPSMTPKSFIRNLCLQAKMDDLLLPDQSDVRKIGKI